MNESEKEYQELLTYLRNKWVDKSEVWTAFIRPALSCVYVDIVKTHTALPRKQWIAKEVKCLLKKITKDDKEFVKSHLRVIRRIASLSVDCWNDASVLAGIHHEYLSIIAEFCYNGGGSEQLNNRFLKLCKQIRTDVCTNRDIYDKWSDLFAILDAPYKYHFRDDARDTVRRLLWDNHIIPFRENSDKFASLVLSLNAKFDEYAPNTVYLELMPETN